MNKFGAIPDRYRNDLQPEDFELLDIPKIRHRNIYSHLRGLVDLVLYLPCDIIVAEIGCFAGASTIIWGLRAKKLYAIDNFNFRDEPGNYTKQSIKQAFIENISKFNNIEFIEKESEEAAKEISDKSLDVVYIDGNHSYIAVRRDILLWLPKIKPGGHISGHDYFDPKCPGVRKAVDEILGKPDKLFIDTSWIQKVV